MGFSVYISGNSIEYLAGQRKKSGISIKQCGVIALEQGVLVENRIQDSEAFADVLCTLRMKMGKEYHEVDLLIDSSLMVTKALNIPILSHQKIRTIIRSELADFIDKEKKYIYDYSVLEPLSVGNDKKGRIYCAAIERLIAEEYVKAFTNASIKIASIEADRCAQFRIAQNHPLLKDRTYILACLNGKTLMASLYVTGNFVYMNEFKLNEERENLGLISELSRIIASFIQFNRSQRTKQEIKTIYMCGMSAKEIGFCPNITNNVGIETKCMPDIPDTVKNTAVYCLSDYFHTSGSMFRQ